MRKVKLSITAVRTNIEDQFEGVATFIDEEGRTFPLTYLCTDPDKPTVDIEFTSEKENFSIKGTPSVELLEPLTQQQRLLFGLTLGLLPGTISQAKMLSHGTTQLLEIFGGKMSAEGSTSFSVDEDSYNCLFENVGMPA